jgi:hypothetical protein
MPKVVVSAFLAFKSALSAVGCAAPEKAEAAVNIRQPAAGSTQGT